MENEHGRHGRPKPLAQADPAARQGPCRGPAGGIGVYGAGLAAPGPTLLLELALARVEARPLRLVDLPEATGLDRATVSRWLELIETAGLAARLPAPARGGARFALTWAGEAAIGLDLSEE